MEYKFGILRNTYKIKEGITKMIKEQKIIKWPVRYGNYTDSKAVPPDPGGGLVPGPTVATSVHRCASPTIGFLYLRFHICGLTSYRQYSTAVLTEKRETHL